MDNFSQTAVLQNRFNYSMHMQELLQARAVTNTGVPRSFGLSHM